ncbi:hypothetical protein QOZ80_6AG0508830 [Eleusine coracana subsp. coracana]|nr:hypothetical protein QOZ80_6AG0508830 [Eleusine coracana subsp. coracana]
MEEEEWRRGIPSLLKSPSPAETEAGCLQEYIASDITQLVGWTPLIELNRITNKGNLNVRIVGKLESYQPLCSVKDRSALRMIEDAEEKGLISPGVTTLVEPTSGNMGIGLAYIALKNPTLGFQGQLDKVAQFKKDIPNVHVLDQFTNVAYPEAHFKWTGPKIWKDTAGKIDIFVAGSGTGGTVSGVGKYLKMKNPAVKVICVEPAESPVISGGKPSRHKIQGVGPGFVPKNLDTSLIDEIITVTAEDAMNNAQRLAREEGFLVGISSGANLSACLKVASREESKGRMIVTMFPSGGERYMNSDLFAAVREECTAMTF